MIVWIVNLGNLIFGILPVDGHIMCDMVDDLHKHCVIFPSIESGTWELPIYGDNGFGGT